MLAEIFTGAKYHAGRDLIPASSSNPHGYFEDIRVNRLNDELMASLPVARDGRRLPRNLWWMEALDGPVRLDVDADWSELVPPEPFVMKDPRFAYTGPAWSTVWGSPLVIVTVRPVGEVTRSLVAMASREPDLFAAMPTADAEFADHVGCMWRSMYRSVLAWVDEDAVFVTEHSVRTGEVLSGLGRLAGAVLSGSTVDQSLHRHADTPSPESDRDDVVDRVERRLRRDAARLSSTRPPNGALTSAPS